MQNRTLYGAVVLLVALLLVTSSLAVIYYNEYQGASATDSRHVQELQASIARYDSLAQNFTALEEGASSENSSTFELATTFGELSQQFNRTISLLTMTVSNLNTSSPAYITTSTQLSAIWKGYLGLVASYQENLYALKNYTATPFPAPIRYTASILIDFGNGTRVWYNNTAIQPGWNFYIGTLIVTGGRVDATWYPQYGEHFVAGIDAVYNNPSLNEAWENWTFNSTSGWQGNLPVGADQQTMFNGSIFAWSYCTYDPSTYVYQCPRP